MKVLIGTNNEAKVKKYGTILNELGIEYCTPKELNLDVEVEEKGSSPDENSKIKARAYYDAVKMPIIVDDCGMVIEGLPEDKQPGVFVRRRNGKRLTDEEWIEEYSKLIDGLGGSAEGAFIIAITVVNEKGEFFTNVVSHERYFVSKPCKARTKGYPANSLIYDREKNKYLAEVYEGSNIYIGNSFEKDYEFIKSVLK